MPGAEPLVRLRGVVKDYRSLRPLRIRALDLEPGRSIAILGLDQGMAEVLSDLITGAILPDRGEIHAFDRATHAIADPGTWLTTLDRFGLLTDRAVLVEQFTVEQNLAMPISIAVETIAADVRARVAALAREVGLEHDLQRQAGVLPAGARARIRLGRALALDPGVLIAEHPSASLDEAERAPFAADLRRIVDARGLSSLVLTADRAFAQTTARDVLVLEPATGELTPASSGWRRWFSSGS